MNAATSMIEHASEFGASITAPLMPQDSADLSAGEMLRHAREGHGLHLEVVAAALKIPPEKLRALEEDDIAALPDVVFARALAASVCRALRIDPKPVLAKMPGAQRGGLADRDRAVARDIRSRHAGHPGGARSPLPRAVIGLAALLLLGAALLYWLPQGSAERISQTLSNWTGRSSSDAAAATQTTPTLAAAPGTVVEPVLTATEPAPAPVPAQATALPETPPAPPAPPPELVTFAPEKDSWITVTEAGGKVLLKRTVKAGETVGVSGKLPLSVVVGHAASVKTVVRGDDFDLKPLIKGGGVARFQVK